jgi:hypothetical protein
MEKLFDSSPDRGRNQFAIDGPGANEGPVVLDRVPCSVCQHDVPLSEAVVAEATDYLMYFCGLDCYARWRNLLQA